MGKYLLKTSTGINRSSLILGLLDELLFLIIYHNSGICTLALCVNVYVQYVLLQYVCITAVAIYFSFHYYGFAVSSKLVNLFIKY